MIIFFYFIDLTFEKKFTIDLNYKVKLNLAKKRYKNNCLDYVKNIN